MGRPEVRRPDDRLTPRVTVRCQSQRRNSQHLLRLQASSFKCNAPFRAVPCQAAILFRFILLPVLHDPSPSVTSQGASAYKTLISLTLPPQSSHDHITTLVCQAYPLPALINPSATLSLLPTNSEDVTITAVSSLARYLTVTTPSPRDRSCVGGAYGFTMISMRETGTKKKRLVRALAETGFAMETN